MPSSPIMYSGAADHPLYRIQGSPTNHLHVYLCSCINIYIYIYIAKLYMSIEFVDASTLPVRFAIESACAVLSAASVAPIISIVDKAIVSNASGLEPLLPCLLNGFKSFLTRPHVFLKQPSFLLIWGVYSGTYIVANCTEAWCERQARSSFYPKFISSSATNVSLSVIKDKAFARMFGTGSPRPLPSISYVLFAMRDSATIFASFSIPGPISMYMQTTHEYSAGFADNCTQLMTPITMQIFSTPLHLHGLDLYNRQTATFSERISFVRQEYVKTVLARMARIFPAFSVGGVLNKKVRSHAKEMMKSAGLATSLYV